MRITNKTLNNTFLNNLNKNLQNMQKAQDQFASGKRVSKPSDDPLLVGKILSMRDNIQQNEQYNSNISSAQGWVQTQDTALGDVNKSMNRIRDLIVYAANGSLSPSDRNAIKDEVEMKFGEIKEVLNTNFDGRYIFGGQKTGTPPFDDDLAYQGNDKNLEREISQGVKIELMTKGGDITTIGKAPDEETLGVFLKDIVKAMDSLDEQDPQQPKTEAAMKADLEKLSGEFLGKTDKFVDNLLKSRSKIGAIDNRLEASLERNKSENINLTSVLSEKEDIDIAEQYMKLTMLQTTYQASLSIGAKILQSSLIDYLR